MRSAWSLCLLMGAIVAAQPAWADDEPPVIEHTPITSATTGEQVTITARITDESEIFPPAVTYRPVGSRSTKAVNMTARKSAGKAEYFDAKLNIDSSVEYWIEVYDEFGNGPAVSGSSSRPHLIEATSPPVVERPAPRPAPKPVNTVVETQDLTPPVIVHEPIREVEGPGPYEIKATITDPSGVFAPTVYYRPDAGSSYASTGMKKDGDEYTASVDLRPPFEYWLEAYDNFGNGPAQEGGADAPYRVTLRVVELVDAAPLLPPPVDEFDAPREISKKWWLIGGAGVVGAAVITGVVYALASQPDYSAWVVTQSPTGRR